MNCEICPRKCNVDRIKTLGYCKAKEKIKIGKVMLHKFEEPIISAGKGSGAIFFSGCNLKCVFCQNYKLSHYNKGRFISTKQLANIFKRLEKKGANNINLVTPTHYTNQIIEALKIYKPNIPIVWNSSGYESKDTIKKLKNYVDIFLVDLKYSSNELAKKYSFANNYVENAQASITEMRAQQPKDVIENGLMKAGVIVRVLVLPNETKDAMNSLKFISSNLGKNTIVSIMSQYTPMFKAAEYPEINRKITPLEYKRVINCAIDLGLTNAYTQELSSATTIYTPKF